jgi:hypothetical protein
MANFALVENNVIIERHDLLPTTWRNVSGLSLLKDDEELLNNLGWYTVTKVPAHYDITTQYIDGYEYSFVDNKVLETPILKNIEIVIISEEERFATLLAELRLKRDSLLIESDWTQLADVQATHTNDWKTAWANYRQQLRDLPNLCIVGQINIYEVIWPTKPE